MNESAGISFRDLLAHNHHETERWHGWFVQHPQALELEVGGKTGTVRNLVKHIFQAEMYFAARLNGEALEPKSIETGSDSLDDIFALHEKAHAAMAHYLSHTDEAALAKSFHFEFGGGFDASARKMVMQFFWHGMNHWGQVALLARQGGFPSLGPHDIILSPVIK